MVKARLDTLLPALVRRNADIRSVVAEAAGGGNYGVAYFERRLQVGRLHNTIDLPFKWYIGSYVRYFDLVRKHLRRSFPHRPLFRARAERAILAVMNADMQAIVEAFYFDTFATMGVDSVLKPTPALRPASAATNARPVRKSLGPMVPAPAPGAAGPARTPQDRHKFQLRTWPQRR